MNKVARQVIVITKDHLINILRMYEKAEIDEQILLDWVNTIWFSDYFEYDENQSASIASVMSELEELDESDEHLSSQKIEYYIHMLNTNQEI